MPTPEILVDDTWLLAADVGTGVGAMPAGAEVVVTEILPPFSGGVAQVNENTVVAAYTFLDGFWGASGNWVEKSSVRRMAYPESVFRELFNPAGGA